MIGVHCSAVNGRAIIKRSKVESVLSSSLTVARMMCQCTVLLKDIIVFSNVFVSC